MLLGLVFSCLCNYFYVYVFMFENTDDDEMMSLFNKRTF